MGLIIFTCGFFLLMQSLSIIAQNLFLNHFFSYHSSNFDYDKSDFTDLGLHRERGLLLKLA